MGRLTILSVKRNKKARARAKNIYYTIRILYINHIQSYSNSTTFSRLDFYQQLLYSQLSIKKVSELIHV